MESESAVAVAEILSRLFDIPLEQITPETSMESVERWDSLQHINLIMDIEERFSFQFEPLEVTNLRNVRAILEAVERRLA